MTLLDLFKKNFKTLLEDKLFQIIQEAIEHKHPEEEGKISLMEESSLLEILALAAVYQIDKEEATRDFIFNHFCCHLKKGCLCWLKYSPDRKINCPLCWNTELNSLTDEEKNDIEISSYNCIEFNYTSWTSFSFEPEE